MTTDTLLYLVHGQETYFREALYSLLSTMVWGADHGSPIRRIVYTDKPEYFSDLPIEPIRLEDDTLADWRGVNGYPFRVKMCVHRDALARYGGKVAFVDTDTYFRANPGKLFDRIAPGRSVMHIAEGRLGEIVTADFAALRRIVAEHVFLDGKGQQFSVDSDAMMWNSGVAGIHHTDAWVLDEAIGMIDQLCRIPAARSVNQIEQFATGVQLSRFTKVSEAAGIVFHYWPYDIKNDFRARLPEILADTRSDNLSEWGRHAMAARPVTSAVRRSKMHVRTALRRIGLRTPGVRTSV